MPAAHRRIVRPATPPSAPTPQRQRQIQRLRAGLDRERAALARWQKRLKRAFTATLKHQKRSARLERQLARMEEPP